MWRRHKTFVHIVYFFTIHYPNSMLFFFYTEETSSLLKYSPSFKEEVLSDRCLNWKMSNDLPLELLFYSKKGAQPDRYYYKNTYAVADCKKCIL